MEEGAAPTGASPEAQPESEKKTESTITQDSSDKIENHIDETVPEKPAEISQQDEELVPDSDSAKLLLVETDKDSETTVMDVATGSESMVAEIDKEPDSAITDAEKDSSSVAPDTPSAVPELEDVDNSLVKELESKSQDLDASVEKNDDIGNNDNKENVTESNNDKATSDDPKPEEAADDSQNDNSQADVSVEEPKHDDNQDKTVEEAPEAASKAPEEAKDDDLESSQPEFETAPTAADESQEDHTQALDPFDALLRDQSTELAADAAEANKSATEPDPSGNADDDDDRGLDADDGHDDSHAHEDEPDAADAADEPDAAAGAEAMGADEEVCLLPDTEREISDADKAAAERVLAENRKLAEEEAATMVPKEEGEPADEPADEVGDELGDELETAPQDEPAQENGDNNQDPTDEPADDASAKKYVVDEIEPAQLTCSECEESRLCYFYYKYDGEDTHYCSLACLGGMMADEADRYTFKRRRLTIKEIEGADGSCSVCEQPKRVYYSCERYGETVLFCDLSCIKVLNAKEAGRYIVRKLRAPRAKPSAQTPPLLKLKVISNATDKYIDASHKIQARTPAAVQAAKEERERSFVRMCTQCSKGIQSDDKNLTWETMEFCDDLCLGKFQKKVGSKCANCQSSVTHTSLGKYCVRFGFDIRQFCNSSCLEEFKKGLKICCYCQKDISSGQEGFLAPIGDKGQFKDFCSQVCMVKFDQMSKNPVPQPVWAKCAVCTTEKATTIEVATDCRNLNIVHRLCSDPCFAAFKFVNNIFPDQCQWCKKYFERRANAHYTIYENNSPMCFCTQSCINVYISNSRFIVPCNWCKVKKYNFDMIKRNKSSVMMCSLNCLSLYQVSVNAVSSRRIRCDMCRRAAQAQYHLTMSDATVRNFCTYQCVMSFQGQYSKPAPAPPATPSGEPLEQAVPTGAPRRTYPATRDKTNDPSPHAPPAAQQKSQRQSSMPVISAVQSLAPPPLTPASRKSKRNQEPVEPPAPKTPPPPPRAPTPPPPPPPKIYNHVLVKTLPPSEVANKATMTKPMMVSKGVSCRPHPCTKECQTDPSLERRILIPVPVPIYVPVPCAMWSIPFPVPVPIPIPIPTPVFIPTTRNSAKGIMKEISKIHDKMPTDPFEAELLMMAEMVAGDKKKDQSDSDTDDDNAEPAGFSPVAGIDGNNFGEDMLQMALKMATEYEEQPVDLESAMTASTITPSSHPGMPGLEGDMHHHHMMVLEQQRAVAALRASAAPRKRAPAPPAAQPARARGKRSRRGAEPPPPEPPREPAEKPDANMCLKYTFGVNAWKQWVMTKNAELEKSSVRKKPFKSEILQLTADELNFSLCLFVREVRKPNGSEYAPDTIYYLVLGIQQYLFENGRIDNIFTDPYYEKFTDCLDEVARKFSVLYNDSQYIVTRVEEEHLWESKQLGAHSPHVLLSTLMFFNTKHFNLVSVDEHMQLSFSHIMKHWKRNPNQPGQAKVPGSRNVLLRFYPPQSALEANSRKKKVYEQQENEENPLRCPVKLYEFYISKCPESVRTRNDVFYLQPERSCVPDSPVWYSTQPLSRAALAKMLHRVKMVKEINIALLTS